MIKLFHGQLRRLPTRQLLTLACWFGLGSLLFFSWAALVPRALSIIGGMSVGVPLGGLAFLFYALAILGESVRKPPAVPAPRNPDEPGT